jgi:hypothetical protein
MYPSPFSLLEKALGKMGPGPIFPGPIFHYVIASEAKQSHFTATI